MNTGETKGILPARFSFRSASALTLATFALGAILALSACSTKTRTVTVTETETVTQRVGDPQAEERAKAAEDALAALEKAQEALTSATTDQQRMAARATVVEAQADLEKLQEALTEQPTSTARTAADTALAALDTALTRVAEALGTTDAALASGAGPLVLASMHTSLDRAQAALDDAQAALKTALAADPSDALRNLLTQAQGTLTTAQVSLVPLLRQELADAEQELADAETEAAAQRTRADTAESEAATQRTRADTEKARADAAETARDAEKARADTYDPRVSLTDALLPLQEERIDLPAGRTGSVTWTPRTRTDVSVSAGVTTTTVVALENDIRDEAVPWADGKRLFPGAGGGRVSAEEFRMRGVTTRADLVSGNAPVMGTNVDATRWSNYEAAYQSSISMAAGGDGATLKMGGDGVIFHDFERIQALGPGGSLNQPDGTTCANTDLAKCDDPVSDDVEATFGRPVADPDGEAAWHFETVVPVNPGTPHTETRSYADLPNWSKHVDGQQRTLYRVSDPAGPYEDGNGRYRVERAAHGSADVGSGWEVMEPRRARRIDYGRPVDELGVYSLWLSNYAGLDEGADAGDAGDDTHRYLGYAAYGLFNFLDYSTAEVGYGRFQAFHFGYEAFRDEAGQRPADWGTSSNPITATFKGRTTGWMMQSPHGNQVSRIIRLRGDLELTATLNAGGDDNQGTISGAMRDFEFLHNGVWGADTRFQLLTNAANRVGLTLYPANDPRLGNAVLLESADIAADGSFEGVAYAAHNSALGSGADNFANGTYGGAFYGPRELGALEAAGYWRLPVDTSPQQGAGTIIGSFGARSEQPTN